jgi:hypothetical protein
LLNRRNTLVNSGRNYEDSFDQDDIEKKIHAFVRLNDGENSDDDDESSKKKIRKIHDKPKGNDGITSDFYKTKCFVPSTDDDDDDDDDENSEKHGFPHNTLGVYNCKRVGDGGEHRSGFINGVRHSFGGRTFFFILLVIILIVICMCICYCIFRKRKHRKIGRSKKNDDDVPCDNGELAMQQYRNDNSTLAEFSSGEEGGGEAIVVVSDE